MAILRFENLSGDLSAGWMARAFPDVIAAELARAPKVKIIPAARIHGAGRALGPRPPAAPGSLIFFYQSHMQVLLR